MEYAKNESQKILDSFEKENISFSSLINFLQRTVPDFGKTYNLYLNDGAGVNVSANHKLNEVAFQRNLSSRMSLGGGGHFTHTYTNTESLQKNRELVEKLRTSKASITTIAATAAIAAAGFYATGVLLPWAVTCTAISVIASTAAAGLSLALTNYDKEMSKINKGFSTLSATITLGHSLGKTAKAILLTLTTTAAPLSWAFPAVLALIATSTAINAWIDASKKGI
ncbi:hypothetical protein EELLY_v1c04560 [Entomoplasma ellychniae]|uniref:Uncharacterized protein n=1 Tax=Entomoplasma ellychniae TaxID=2114 RepID=A0A8E2QW46_9MOLU|nr:hypothetical protein [Entomoplasma ellychniae]PPE04776.1 hypothetical protein EELLY_v1c04560 [Entomoplasma ellychniae]